MPFKSTWWIVWLLVLLLGFVLIGGYVYKLDWMGLWESPPRTEAVQDIRVQDRMKTLWDWMQILIVPIMIAGGGFWFDWRQRKRDERANEEQRKRDKENRTLQKQREEEIATQRAQDAALQQYLSQMSSLLVDKNKGLLALLSNSETGSSNGQAKPAVDPVVHAVTRVAKARTIAVLLSLDETRKRHVIKLLYELGLITNNNGNKPIVDLEDADLQGANLQEANLQEAFLNGVFLRGADLSNADMRRADLSRAKLEEAILTGSKLHNADLSGANLRGANLSGAKLRGANLVNTDLTNADLRGAQLNPRITETDGNPDRTYTNLTGAILRGAQLENANLIDVDLTSAELYGADLSGAKLKGASLTGTKLKPYTNGTDGTYTKLSDADLRGADLETAKGLTQDQIEEAIGDQESTQLPEHLKPPEAWDELSNE